MRRLVLYPAAIAAAWVLSQYLPPVPPLYILVRPLVVAIGIVLVLQVAFSMLARNRHVGAFAAVGVPLMLVSWELGAALVLAVVVPLLYRSVRQRSLATVDWPSLTRFLTAASAIVLVVTLVMAGSRGITPVGQTSPPQPVAAVEGPDIYLIMLDGYPRADTLARDFGFDNEPFLRAMEAQGFEVAREAHANYNITWFTLASMFNGRHLDALMPKPSGDIGAQLGVLNRLINDGTVLKDARGAGYELVAISGGMVSASLTSADRFIDTGQVNSFEAPLLRLGVLPYILPSEQAAVLHGQLRDRFNAEIATLRTLAHERGGRPRLVWAHLLAPHPPVVFDEMGGPSSDDGCYPLACGLFDQVYDSREPQFLREELQYVNAQLLALAADVIASNERPVVMVLFSDHGFRHDYGDLREMVHSLFVSYTPGQPGLFPSNASPINLLPTVLNNYAGTQIPLAQDGSFIADFRKFDEQKSYFPLVPVEP